MNDLVLWERISGFQLDKPDDRLPFSARLAREMGWTKAFAKRACEEYLRFVFLTQVSPEPVTPSDVVDEVWHLHLCYTRSYWDDMCGEVLKRPLHHGPTVGGDAEDAKFALWYARTLSLYHREFGDPPPAEFWPEAAKRFGHHRWKRVETASHWVLSKSRTTKSVGAVSAMALAGCTAEAGGGAVLPFMLVAGIIGLALLLAFRLKQGNSNRGGAGGNHSWTDTGYVETGAHHHGDSSDSSGCGSSGCSSSGCGGGGCGGGGGD